MSSDANSQIPGMPGKVVPSLCWQAFGASVRGASHLKSGLPNQDSFACRSTVAAAGYAVMAVSDGHGSAKCFRSDRGSRFAVESAMETLQELREYSARDVNALLEDGRCIRSIFARWNDKVKADLAQDPIAAASQVDKIEPADAVHVETIGSDNGNAAASVTTQPETPSLFLSAKAREPYGATLLAALLTDKFGLFLQLGDGDMLVLTDDDSVETIFDHDPEQIANETKSLCGSKPLAEFHSKIQVWAGRPPKLFMLSTDGYSNAFSEVAGFHQAISDIQGILSKDGGEQLVQSQLGLWLEKASMQGSGDDVTVGLLWRTDEDKPEDVQNDNTQVAVVLPLVDNDNNDQTVGSAEPVSSDIHQVSPASLFSRCVSFAGAWWFDIFILLFVGVIFAAAYVFFSSGNVKGSSGSTPRADINGKHSPHDVRTGTNNRSPTTADQL
jgi:serine/threonine protein phosphatase PrpC